MAHGLEARATEGTTGKMQIEHLTGKKVVHPVKVPAEAFGIRGKSRRV